MDCEWPIGGHCCTAMIIIQQPYLVYSSWAPSFETFNLYIGNIVTSPSERVSERPRSPVLLHSTFDLNPVMLSFAAGCENRNCDYYSICESDGSAAAKCVCPESCVEVSGISSLYTPSRNLVFRLCTPDYILLVLTFLFICRRSLAILTTFAHSNPLFM